MYYVKYGSSFLHDPKSYDTERKLIDLKLSGNENTCGYLDFTIYPTHPMYGSIQLRDYNNLVEVYDGELLLFRGYIYEMSKGFNLDVQVSCCGELDMLNDSVIRPYTTLLGEEGVLVPNTLDGYFFWLIEQHNKQVDPSKQFKVGINQGWVLDPNNYIYRSSTMYPKTFDEITSKILDTFDAKIRLRYENGERIIDLLAEWDETNAQILDFGVNLMDYSHNIDSTDLITAIIPLGSYEEGTKVDISTLGNGPTGFLDFVKLGDMIYSPSAQQRYGWVLDSVSFDDVTLPENLLGSAAIELAARMSPIQSIDIRAVDMHLINPTFKPIRVGEYVRVRSIPHNFDSYMICSSIDLDLESPDNSTYSFGTSYATLTGEQNKKIRQMNANTNRLMEEYVKQQRT